MTDANHSGRLIALEGGEGAGKSRLLAVLGARLRDGGRDVVLTREPGGTALGEQIRALVTAQDALDDPLAELLLFEAARAHLVASVILPALARGAVVITDRFAASSIAYQAFGRGLDRAIVQQANALATGGLAPDLTLLLDLDVAAGLARRAGDGDGDENHFDRETLDFHERIRAGYHQLAQESPQTWRVIDAGRPFDDVLASAMEAVGDVERL